MTNVLIEMHAYLQQMFSTFLGDLIVAAIILIMGFVAGKIAERLILRFLHSVELDNVLSKAASIKFSLETLLSHIVSYFIYFLAVIMALNKLGLTTTVLYIISASVLALIVLATLLAMKDFLPNAIAGFLIYQKQMFKQDDFVHVKDIEGTVKKINLIESQLETKSGDIIHIPNSTFTNNEFLIKKKT